MMGIQFKRINHHICYNCILLMIIGLAEFVCKMGINIVKPPLIYIKYVPSQKAVASKRRKPFIDQRTDEER